MFCYLTFTGRPLSLQLLSGKPVAKIWGETEEGTVTVAVQGGHGTFYKDAGQGREGGAEWEGGEKGQVQWVPCPPPPISFSVFLPVTSHHWEEMGSFSFKCLPEKKDRGLSSPSLISQKKDEAASRVGIRWLAFFFPLSIYHCLAAGTPGRRQLRTFPSRLPAVAGPGSVAARLAVPTLASSPPSGSYSFDSSPGQPFGSTDWYLTWKRKSIKIQASGGCWDEMTLGQPSNPASVVAFLGELGLCERFIVHFQEFLTSALFVSVSPTMRTVRGPW